MNIGFTGTQEGLSQAQSDMLRTIARTFPKAWGRLNHGCCIGADEEAHLIFKNQGYSIGGYPPINTSKMAHFNIEDFTFYSDPEEYLVRNTNIVDASDLLIACPRTHSEERRSGTWATIRYARLNLKPVLIIV